MSSSPRKGLEAFLIPISAAGVGAVAYGMTAKDDIVFIAGVCCSVAAYLLVRKRLRESACKTEGKADPAKADADRGG
jgi:uncharacterized membrane protein YdjX (TVP38/TMEM64 family)